MGDTTPPGTGHPLDIAARLASVRADLARAAREAGREQAPELIAVSKLMPAEAIGAALDAGQRVFGENYVQEAKAKWPAFRARHDDIELHLVGPLQSNKAREAVELFDVIQSLDRPSLASALANELTRIGRRRPRRLRLLVQVNTGDEPQKSGVVPQDLPGFLTACREIYRLDIEGLMAIPPADEPPSAHFAFLAKLAAAHDLDTLSMGMSADYEQAVMLGATHVRIGTAIFGARG